MGLRLGSQELADEFWRLQKEKDPEFIQAFKGLNIRLILLGTDAPGKEDKQLFLDIEDGQFVEIIPETKPAPSDLRTKPFDHKKYDCRAIAPQQTLVDLCNGKIDLIEAITKVKIEGDIGKLMAQFAEFMSFISYLGKKGIEP
jgi:putative sterol carrier protein